MEKLYSLFFKSTKPRSVEELIDFYFHRRLAVPFVQLAIWLKLTPNQVTALSLLSGCTSAFFFYHGLFFLGAFWLLLAIVLDCTDGMLARATGQTSPIGRGVDGLFDLIWVALIWIGIFFSRRLSLNSSSLLLLMAGAGAGMTLRTWTYDGVKTTYLSLCYPDYNEQHLTTAQIKEGLKNALQKKSLMEIPVYLAMWFQHAVFGQGLETSKKNVLTQSVEQIRSLLDPPMRCWSFLGEGTQLFMMTVAGLLTPLFPEAMTFAFWFMLIPMNVWWLFSAIYWFRQKDSLNFAVEIS